MNLREFIGCIEKFSPPALALSGDPVGIQVGPLDPVIQDRARIRKCAVAVDASPQVILKAASSGVNVLVTYHSVLSDPVANITNELYDKVRLLIQSRIFLYTVHTSWLSAECGLNDTLADILGLVVTEPLTFDYQGKDIPIGRICSFAQHHEKRSSENGDSIQLSDFIARIVERLRSNDVFYVGSLHAPVKRVALLASQYARTDLLRLAKIRGVDTYLTGGISREVATLSSELGLSYVYANQHIMEALGMRRLMQLLGVDAPEVEFLFIESQCPWKTYIYPHSLTRKDDETREV